MKKLFLLFYFLLNLVNFLYSQDAPNLANSTAFSGNTQESNKLSSVPVNIFTGIPNVSVPIYKYNSPANNLNWSVTLDYFAGGTQLTESASTVGLGWFLNSTGVVTRAVRGMPDDMPTNGYLYSPSIPTDYRSNGNKYYFDSLDAEQDIFQFSFNGRSGKFLIGKNKQIILLPNSKLRVSYSVSSADNSTITGFKIITENGTKFLFNDPESTNINSSGSFNYGYANYTHNTAWYLSKVIAPFNTDSISFSYSNVGFSSGFTYPQVTYVRNSDGTRTATYTPSATSAGSTKKLSSIAFPDNRTLSITYSSFSKYSANDYAAAFIKISDSIFRYGYALHYNSSGSNLTLKDITPYTSTQMQKGYSFTYNNLFTPQVANDYNKIDFWGFYNGAANGSNLIYQPGSSLSANRDPNINYAINNSLQYYYLPGGGYIYYEYELNDHYPYIKDPHTLIVPGNTTAIQNNAVTLNQVFNTKHQIVFNLDPSVSRNGNSPPISGTGSLICNIKSSDGTILYSTTTISLYDLFYLGIKSWTFNLPNGSYLLQTQLSSGTTVSGSFPINVNWENKLTDNSKSATTSGGLRVKRITRRDATDDPNITAEEYKYLTEDGKSSGFFGDIPKFDYPYSETVINGSTTTTAYTLISSDPINTLNYTQGSPVGYSRVVVFRGSSSHNIGKTVYEFTNMQDVNSNITTSVFPYVPQDVRDWALGLPKQVSIYDSIGTLIKRTTNKYRLDTLSYINSNFLSLKLGNSFTQYNGNPSIASTPRIRTFLGQQYYPSNGRMYLSSTYDTIFHTDGSMNIGYKNYLYDTSFNVKTITTSYNRNTGLQLETRLYYPYNYIVGGAIGKLRDSGIIAPVIAAETWITGDANPRIISGNITDYQQTGSYIKPLTSYALQSNKPVIQSSIGLFDSSKINRNENYFIPQLNYSQYDSKSNLLQTKSLISGQSNSVIMDYNNQYVIAKVSNAAYSDIAYTSFEADGTGNWVIGSTARDVSGGLTGKKAYDLSNGNITKTNLNASLSYIISVWASSSASVAINGSAQTAPIARQQGWNLYFTTLTGISSVTVSGSGTIDELRLYPKDANMVTNTYEPAIGVTSACDQNNTVIYTTYDNLNRVKVIKDKDLNIIKRFDYADQDMPISLNPYWVLTSFTWPNQYCGYDSTFTDNNPFSNTYNTTRTTNYVNFCGCPSLYPQYKTLNGKCEQGIKQYSGSVYNGPNQYNCTYHYVWSDCSVSQNYQEANSSPCTITSGCP